jgi:hypothetical protein
MWLARPQVLTGGSDGASPPTLPGTTAVFAMSLVATILLLYSYGLSFFVRTRGQFALDLVDDIDRVELGLGLTLALQLNAAAAIFMVSALLSNLRTSSHRRPALGRVTIFAAMALVGIGLYAIVNFPARQARYTLFAFLLSLVFVWAAQKRSRLLATRNYIILLFPFFLYVVFWIVGQVNRSEDIQIERLWSISLNIRDVFGHADFDGYQMAVAAVDYVARVGHSGSQLLGALFFFVPRSVWAEKALASGSLLAQDRGMQFANLSCNIFAEAYLDFGLVGVIGLAMLLGYVFTRADARFQRSNQPWALLPQIIAISFMPILLRGALLAVVAPVAATLMWAALLVRLGGWNAHDI